MEKSYDKIAPWYAGWIYVLCETLRSLMIYKKKKKMIFSFPLQYFVGIL